jgi:hypothetical protein
VGNKTKIVRRWEHEKGPAVEFADGRVTWDDGMFQPQPWTWTRGQIVGTLIERIIAGPPTWVDPEWAAAQKAQEWQSVKFDIVEEHAAIVSSWIEDYANRGGYVPCAYVDAVAIKGVESEALDPHRYTSGKEIRALNMVTTKRAKYDAPAAVQEAEASARVLSRAKRLVREMPICSATGEPVEIRAQQTTDNRMIAIFACPLCGGWS